MKREIKPPVCRNVSPWAVNIIPARELVILPLSCKNAQSNWGWVLEIDSWSSTKMVLQINHTHRHADTGQRLV